MATVVAKGKESNGRAKAGKDAKGGGVLTEVSGDDPPAMAGGADSVDNRVRIRKSRQTVRITVTITDDQHRRLRTLAETSGFNASELVRYALLQFFRQPYIFLSRRYTNDKQELYNPLREQGGDALPAGPESPGVIDGAVQANQTRGAPTELQPSLPVVAPAGPGAEPLPCRGNVTEIFQLRSRVRQRLRRALFYLLRRSGRRSCTGVTGGKGRGHCALAGSARCPDPAGQAGDSNAMEVQQHAD